MKKKLLYFKVFFAFYKEKSGKKRAKLNLKQRLIRNCNY